MLSKPDLQVRRIRAAIRFIPVSSSSGISATGGGIPGLIATGTSPLGPPSAAVQQDIDAEAARVNSNPTAIHRRLMDVDESELIFIARRKIDFLSRRQRSMVFGEGHH